MSQASQQIGAAGVAAPPAAAGGTAAPPAAQQATVSPRPTSASPSLEAQTPGNRKMNTPQRLQLLSLGVVVAGLVIGVSEAVTMAVASPSWAPIVSFSLLIVMLLFRPAKAGA